MTLAANLLVFAAPLMLAIGAIVWALRVIDARPPNGGASPTPDPEIIRATVEEMTRAAQIEAALTRNAGP